MGLLSSHSPLLRTLTQENPCYIEYLSFFASSASLVNYLPYPALSWDVLRPSATHHHCLRPLNLMENILTCLNNIHLLRVVNKANNSPNPTQWFPLLLTHISTGANNNLMCAPSDDTHSQQSVTDLITCTFGEMFIKCLGICFIIHKSQQPHISFSVPVLCSPCTIYFLPSPRSSSIKYPSPGLWSGVLIVV